MTQPNELADLCERAGAPSRELDCAIKIATTGDTQFGSCWPFHPENPPMLSEYVEHFRAVLDDDDAIPDSAVPRYTASIDAALTLVPGSDWVLSAGSYEPCLATIYSGDDRVAGSHGYAKTPALALVAAALRANGGDDE